MLQYDSYLLKFISDIGKLTKGTSISRCDTASVIKNKTKFI